MSEREKEKRDPSSLSSSSLMLLLCLYLLTQFLKQIIAGIRISLSLGEKNFSESSQSPFLCPPLGVCIMCVYLCVYMSVTRSPSFQSFLCSVFFLHSLFSRLTRTWLLAMNRLHVSAFSPVCPVTNHMNGFEQKCSFFGGTDATVL